MPEDRSAEPRVETDRSEVPGGTRFRGFAPSPSSSMGGEVLARVEEREALLLEDRAHREEMEAARSAPESEAAEDPSDLSPRRALHQLEAWISELEASLTHLYALRESMERMIAPPEADLVLERALRALYKKR